MYRFTLTHHGAQIRIERAAGIESAAARPKQPARAGMYGGDITGEEDNPSFTFGS